MVVNLGKDSRMITLANNNFSISHVILSHTSLKDLSFVNHYSLNRMKILLLEIKKPARNGLALVLVNYFL